MSTTGRVEALCISERKGERKTAVESANFVKDRGIVGDAHVGNWHRQVSILAKEDISEFASRISDCRKAGSPVRESEIRNPNSAISPGSFAENVIVSGLDLASYGLGTRIRLGRDVILSISQIGKVCHAPCRIQQITGDCIMPRLGLFARVEAGGSVRPGDAAEAIQVVQREAFQAVILTMSDRCSRGETQDTAGPAVARLLEQKLGAHIYRIEVLPDEESLLVERLKHYCDGHSIDLVAAVGGTGFSPRDVTPEATRKVIERFTPGLDEAMRAGSLAKTPRAALSRGVSGIRGSTLILDLPGSERAAVENIESILAALDHGLTKLRGSTEDCGRP